jgi:hypothetical protein
MALDDFIRLNTTSYNGLALGATNTVAAESLAVDPGFLEMNIGSFEYSATDYTEPLHGIR